MRLAAAALCALCLVAAVSSVAADRRIIPDYKGYIRVEGGRFVDDNCNLFPVTGLNACVSPPIPCPSWPATFVVSDDLGG